MLQLYNIFFANKKKTLSIYLKYHQIQHYAKST